MSNSIRFHQFQFYGRRRSIEEDEGSECRRSECECPGSYLIRGGRSVISGWAKRRGRRSTRSHRFRRSPQGREVLGLRQPVLGIVATATVTIISLAFISLFEFPLFAGWISYGLLCIIPMQIVIGITWGSKLPAAAARRGQPQKGVSGRFRPTF